jgi:hypothetical protein
MTQIARTFLLMQSSTAERTLSAGQRSSRDRPDRDADHCG